MGQPTIAPKKQRPDWTHGCTGAKRYCASGSQKSAVSYTHLDVYKRQGLIHALLSAEYSSAASNLMRCLAMQGDDKAMETLLELKRNPRPWRKGLYVDPVSYTHLV